MTGVPPRPLTGYCRMLADYSRQVYPDCAQTPTGNGGHQNRAQVAKYLLHRGYLSANFTHKSSNLVCKLRILRIF
jgi:hypothetical protein